MKWFLVILFSLFGILFLGKGIELWAVIDQVDGSGIGISFFGFEIIEMVLKESLPGYALGFTVASLIPILVAVNIGIKSRFGHKNKQHKI